MIERYRVDEIHSKWTDKNKFDKWFEVELAVLKAREDSGEIPEGTVSSIKDTQFEVKRIREIEEETHHDVIAFIQAVQENAGSEAGFLHQGMTSSDVVDTAYSLILKEVSEVILDNLEKTLEIIEKKAVQNKGIPIMGRTHGIHAEPTSLGLKILSWYSELKRAKERFIKAAQNMEYGKISGAVGNLAHLDPEIEEKALRNLGLKPEPVSTQVIPRDRYAEYQFSLAMIGTSIEHTAKEIRHLQRTEIRELEEPFRKGQKGSSAMPHKRNPIICERLCGMSRLLRSHVQTSMENISLWNERDISHSSTERMYIPDSTELVVYMLKKLSFVVENLNIYKETIKENLQLTGGLVYSQNVLIALLDKGMSREDAYKIIQKNAMEVWNEGGSFKDRLKSDKRLEEIISEDEIDSLFKPEKFLKNEGYIFKRVLG